MKRSVAAWVFGVAAVFAANAHAEPCALCSKEIVTNSDLATCFLSDYQRYADKQTGAVMVDLTGCETSRGVVEALAMPMAAAVEPDLQFMLSRSQLDCLKRKLEEPGLALDPSARIDLDLC